MSSLLTGLTGRFFGGVSASALPQPQLSFVSVSSFAKEAGVTPADLKDAIDGADAVKLVWHVWEAHKTELAKHGCHTIDDVAMHIARMVVPGAPIYCEFKKMRGDHRVAVLKNSSGSLILEPRNERRGFGNYVVAPHAHGAPPPPGSLSRRSHAACLR